MDPEGMILDLGRQSVERIKGAIDEAATLVWNGPLGAFETTPFDKGTVEEIFDAADAAGCTIHLPYDVVVAKEFKPNPETRTVNVHEVAADEMILDIGPAASEALGDVLKTCRTLVWNGPLGAFATPPFDGATMTLARTVAALTREGSLVSVAGGGDTVAALNQAGVAGDMTFVSTAGGAFLEWMEGKELPGVKALSA
jgi:phosphoglycerate kinase